MRAFPVSFAALSVAAQHLRDFGARRAVAICEANAAALAVTAPLTAALHAEAARILERGYVAARVAA